MHAHSCVGLINTVDVSIDVSSGADASVYEGGNVDISCTSTGVPVPTNITWTFNNQPTSFLQSDVYTNYSVNSDAATHAVAVLPGSVVSTLHIVNAQYPADAGEYMCTSFNTHAGVTANSSATIPVQFIGMVWHLLLGGSAVAREGLMGHEPVLSLCGGWGIHVT